MQTQLLFIQGAGKGAYVWEQPLIDALQGELGEQYTIRFPRMPKEESPQYAFWAQKIEEELKQLKDSPILIGHSLGGSVLLKLLSEQGIDRAFPALFLLATPFWSEPDWEVEEFYLDRNFASKLPAIGQTFIYHSRDDEVAPFYHHESYHQVLPEAIVRTFDTAGHEMVAAASVLVKDILSLKTNG